MYRCSGWLLIGCCLAAEPITIAESLAIIRAVGPEGTGNVEAVRAWQRLTQHDSSALLPTLKALDGASPAASNWLRSAIDVLAESAQAAGKLPRADLEGFLADRRHAPRGRHLAYDWLVRADPKLSERWLPNFLDDPSADLRFAAVAHQLARAEQLQSTKHTPEALSLYRKLLVAARDREQVKTIASRLADLGEPVDAAERLGFLRSWLVVGPLPNPADDAGLTTVYPPEHGLDERAEFVGKNAAKLRWQPFRSTDEMAIVDFNKAIGKHDAAVAYAAAVIESPLAQPVELRLASNNLVKVFLNGKELLEHRQSHHGMRFDQLVAKGKLAAGRNTVLVKVVQDDGKKSKVRWWSFHLRLCDSSGAALAVKQVVPAGGK